MHQQLKRRPPGHGWRGVVQAWLLALIGALVATLITALAAPPAQAHPMPESRVWVDTTPTGLRLTLHLPLNRLEFALGQPLADAPDTVLPRLDDTLSRYLLLHVGARGLGPGAAGWQALRPALRVVGHDRNAELEAVMTLRAPDGADPRRVTLLLDAVTHEVKTHRVQVLLRNDWSAGFVAQPPRLLGQFDPLHTALPLALGLPHTGAGIASLLAGGMHHIADGTDHPLFLLMLLVVAPLSARAGRWAATRPLPDALRHTAWVVSAFTLGHSLTLALGSTGVLAVPAAPVEVAVALSIAVAAVHAMRPLFHRADIAMALVFGLVHGLAFSASLSGAGLSTGQHALALLAFNLGIEAMQLLLVAAVLPLLLIVAHRQPPAYRALRGLSAVAALGMALIWTGERLGALGAAGLTP